jgi:exodeoxyribonuclease-3
MKLVTWNVNSIRARLARVTAWLERHEPSVLCMQETKVEDEAFPREAFERVGYRVVCHGERGRNGVAIASRLPLEQVRAGFEGDDAEATRRVLAARIGDVDVLTVYVPNGQSVGSEAYLEKIDWLVRLRQHLETSFDPKKPLVVCGDFNIAPDDRDIYDVRLRGGLHCSKPERDALAALERWGLKDALRLETEEPGHYTWWDYYPSAWKKNQGLRIDLVLVTEPLAARLESLVVDKEERSAGVLGKASPEKVSDHAPVLATFRDS